MWSWPQAASMRAPRDVPLSPECSHSSAPPPTALQPLTRGAAPPGSAPLLQKAALPSREPVPLPRQDLELHWHRGSPREQLGVARPAPPQPQGQAWHTLRSLQAQRGQLSTQSRVRPSHPGPPPGPPLPPVPLAALPGLFPEGWGWARGLLSPLARLSRAAPAAALLALRRKRAHSSGTPAPGSSGQRAEFSPGCTAASGHPGPSGDLDWHTLATAPHPTPPTPARLGCCSSGHDCSVLRPGRPPA